MSNLLWVTWLRRIVLLAGVAAALWGVGWAVNGATHPPSAPVQVPVTLDSAGYRYLDITVPALQPGDPEWFALARHSTFMLEATGANRVEQLLARGDALVYGLSALVVALALAPVLTSIARQQPFERGNTARLAVIAFTVAIGGVVAPLLPQYQGVRALHRTGLAELSEPAGPYFDLQPSIPLVPLLVAATILAVAAAFRAGERLTVEVEGLV